MKNGVKMVDIAKEVGVSIVTVSNALAGRDGVSSELRKKICDTAEKMGYKASNTKIEKKASVRKKLGKNVGLLTPERYVGARGTFYWELTAAISNKLAELDVYTSYECISYKNETEGILPKIIADDKVDGIFVIGQLHRSYIELLSKIRMPLVFVDFYDNRFDIDSVNSDSYHGGYILTDYLVKMGHREIGFFGNVTATSSIHDRFLGYIKCLMENGFEYRSEWTLNDRYNNGNLFTKIDFPEKMPTAFVCNCDETAFRVIAALKSKGIRVPEDISVVGYDNYTVSNICIPTITTIEVDIEKMAAVSVEIMTRKLLDASFKEGRRIISGRLIEKNSVLDISGSYSEKSGVKK